MGSFVRDEKRRKFCRAQLQEVGEKGLRLEDPM